MNVTRGKTFYFGKFELDAETFTLYMDGDEVDSIQKKPLEVLATLLTHSNRLVSHDEIIESVWGDNASGITNTNINQYISRVQKGFAKLEPNLSLIENRHGRGYQFVGDVTVVYTGQTEKQREQNSENKAASPTNRSPAQNRVLKVGLAIFLVSLLLFALARYMPLSAVNVDDEKAIATVLRDGNLYESLTIYQHPSNFKESDLDKYWTPVLEMNAAYDRTKIKTAVENMLSEGRAYGELSSCEQFEIQSIKVDKNNQFATAQVLEKWFVTQSKTNGEPITPKTIGPIFVDYSLRKIEGRWLIEKSTTPRANVPLPILREIELVSAPVANKQFFVNLRGDDFLSDRISVLVTGIGCNETDPCLVPNSALRKHSRFTPNLVENVPLTLASGEFMVAVRNGTSKPSQSIILKVP